MNRDCHEAHLIRLLDQARKGKKEAAEGFAEIQSAAPRLLWMEADDLMESLQRQQASKRGLGAAENFIIFLRLVELLCRNGFSSPLYQQLIGEPSVRCAVKQECAADQGERFKSLSLIPPKCGGHLFFEAATYLTAEGFGRLRSGRDLMALAGTEAMSWFAEAFFAEDRAQTEAVDHIPEGLRENFLLLARLAMIGIAAESGSFRRRAFTERLLLGARRFCSHSVGNIDLWLQRRAFLRHAQRCPEWAETYHPPVRPILYAYLAVRTGLTMEKRLALAAEIEQSLHRLGLFKAEGAEAVALLRGL